MKGVSCDITSGLLDLISSPRGTQAFYERVVPRAGPDRFPSHDQTSLLVEHCQTYGLSRKTIGQVIDRGFRSLQLLALLPSETIPIKFPEISDRQRSLLRICIDALERYSRPEFQVFRGLLRLEDVSKPFLEQEGSTVGVNQDKAELNSAMELLNAVKKLLECPVCYQLCGAPRMWQCTNGHLTCDQCHEHSTLCPLCRSSFSNVRPLVLEKLSRQVPMKCKNSGHGCPLSLAHQEREVHEQYCEFTPGHCPVLSCTMPFLIRDTLQHMELQHNMSIDTACLRLHPGTTMSFRSSISMGSYMAGASEQQNWWWGPQFVVYESIPFFFVISRRVVEQGNTNQGYFYFWLWVGGNSTEAKRFLYTLTIEGGEGERVCFTTVPVSLSSSVAYIREKQRCLLLMDSAVHRMTVSAGEGVTHKLQYRIELVDKDWNKKPTADN